MFKIKQRRTLLGVSRQNDAVKKSNLQENEIQLFCNSVSFNQFARSNGWKGS